MRVLATPFIFVVSLSVIAACSSSGASNDPSGVVPPSPSGSGSAPRTNENPPPPAKPPGTLDETFGASGTAVIAKKIAPNAAVVQPDGKVVIAGTAFKTSNLYGTDGEDVALVRLTSTGALDSSFGAGGIAQTHLGRIGQGENYGRSLSLLPDGKLLLHGFVVSGFDKGAVTLTRFLTDGKIDPSYGSSGTVTIDVGRGSFVAVSTLADGRAVVLAMRDNDGLVARYDVQGNADPTFSVIIPKPGVTGLVKRSGDVIAVTADGFIHIDPSGNSKPFAPETPGGLDDAPEGRVLLSYAKAKGPGATAFDMVFKVVSLDGTPVAGSVEAVFDPGATRPTQQFLPVWQKDGRLVVVVALGAYSKPGSGGISVPLESAVRIARYDAKGNADTTFGTTATASLDSGVRKFASAAAVGADGKLVVVTEATNSASAFEGFSVVRLWL